MLYIQVKTVGIMDLDQIISTLADIYNEQRRGRRGVRKIYPFLCSFLLNYDTITAGDSKNFNIELI